MAIWRVDGETQHADVRDERINAGTIGGEHGVPGTLRAQNMSGVVSPFDPRVKYVGGWSIAIGQSSEDFLGRNTETTTAGNAIVLNFSGTSVSVIGLNSPAGGYADVYVDGVLQGGRVNTYSYLPANAYNLSGLNGTDTTITVFDTSGFTSTGSIVIDAEVVSYTGKTSTTFTGCTRSGNQSHQTSSMVYQYNSTVNFYTPYHQSRTTVWSNTALSPGQHTLALVVRSDHDPSSTNTAVHIGGFVVGGIFGANNIITSLDYLKYQNITFDANGNNSSASVPIYQGTTNQQILGVLGATAYNGATAKPCFVSYEPKTGVFSYYCPTGASSTLDVVITVMVLAASI